MSVQQNSTTVPFGEVDREPWRSAGTVPCVRAHRYQGIITARTGNEGLALSRSGTAVLAVPAAAVPHRTAGTDSATKGRQPLALGVPHPQATPAVELHALDLGDGEQRVRHESVIAEHRVVEAPHPDSVEPRTKTVGDVLRHAALIIEERGWNQGAYESGDGYCIYGAVHMAEHGDANGAQFSGPINAVYRHLVDSYNKCPIPWNDEPGRTAAEVTAALRAAADEADR